MKFAAPVSFIHQTVISTKTLIRGEGLTVSKLPPPFTSALVVPKVMTPQELAERLGKQNPTTAYAKWAIPRVGPVPCIALTNRDAAAGEDAAIATVKAAFPKSAAGNMPTIGLGAFMRPSGPGWFPIDYDPPKGGSSLSVDGILIALEEVAPGISLAPRVVFHSASSFISTPEGQAIFGQGGVRILIGIRNAQDTQRAGQALFDRLWLAGKGWTAITDSGRVEVKSIPDLAVTSKPAQPDFYGRPFLQGGGLVDVAPAPSWFDGNGIGYDTELLLPPVWGADLERLRSLQQREIEAREEEAQLVAAAYRLKIATEAATRKGTTVDEELAVLKVAYGPADGEVRAIPETLDIFTRAKGWMSVRAIGEAGMAEFKADAYCADPLEPLYMSPDGKPTAGKAKIVAASPAMVRIKSYAHGAGTQYVWLAGIEDIQFDDSEDLLVERPDPAWDGTGVGPAWDDDANIAQTAVASAHAALEEAYSSDLSACLATLTQGGTFNHLRFGVPAEQIPHKFAYVAQDVARIAAKAVPGSVRVIRKGTARSALVVAARKEIPPPSIRHEDGKRAIVEFIQSTGTKNPAVLGMMAASTLPPVVQAIREAAEAGDRIELVVPNRSIQKGLASALGAYGITVLPRPSRLGKDAAGRSLCSKRESIQIAVDAGVRSRFFEAHCRRTTPAGYEFCTDFGDCSYNQQMRALRFAQVVTSLGYTMGAEVNEILDAAPPRKLVALGLEPTADAVAWDRARVGKSDAKHIAAPVVAVMDALEAGLPLAGIRDGLISREDMANLEVLSLPPVPTRPGMTAKKALKITKARFGHGPATQAAPWAIAGAICAFLKGQGALAVKPSGAFVYQPEPGLDRLNAVDALALVSPTPLSGAVMEAIAGKVGNNGNPAQVSWQRMADAEIPASAIILSRYPKASQAKTALPEAIADLVDALTDGAKAGAKILCLAHTAELAKKLSEATREALTGHSVWVPRVFGNHNAPEMPEGGVDVIVVTATDPSAMAMSAARIWHKSHDQLEFKQAVSREFVLRVPEPRVKRPGALMTALIQTDATDVQEIEQRQAISYAVPEALVVASAAQGREPVLIILDTVHPRWEVDALLPRSLILPNAVDRALLVKMLDDPWASQQELIDWLCEAAPEQFKAAAAAKKYLQRFSPAAAHAFAVCRSAWRGKESAPDLVQASWQVELEDAAGRGEDLSEPVLPYPDGGDV